MTALCVNVCDLSFPLFFSFTGESDRGVSVVVQYFYHHLFQVEVPVSLRVIKGCCDERLVTTTSLTLPDTTAQLRVTAANTEEDMGSIKATAMVITLLTFCLLATNTSAGMH